jgi:hypothetical protein
VAIIGDRLPFSETIADAASSARRKLPGAAVVVARLGLVARTVFYLLLVYLIVRLAVASPDPQQTNAHGVLATVARGAVGTAVLAATAAGFAGFGAVRVWAAVRRTKESAWERTSALLQGLFYLALTWIPASYALGNQAAGNEQSQHQTAGDLLHLPGGRVIVFGLGLVIVGVSLYQIWNGVDRDYVDGMAIEHAPRWVRGLVLGSGTIGIPARALTFLPLGIFFTVAAVQGNPARADGLDGELTALTGNPWGEVVLVLSAAGLMVFAVYSAMEVRYRELTR